MRTIFPILFLASGAFASTDYNHLIEQGRASLTAFDLDSAQAAYSQACQAETPAELSLPRVAQCEHELGTVAETRGLLDEARDHYLKALSIWKNLGNSYLDHHIATITNLAGIYRRQHEFDKAATLFEQSLEMVKPFAVSTPDLYATVLSRAAGLYGDLDRPDRARPLLDESIAVLLSMPSPEKAELAYVYSALGMLDLNTGLYKSGEANLRQAVTLAGQSLGETNPETAAYSTNLALALLIQGQFGRAESLLRRARFVIESRLGPDSLELVNVLAELSSAETGLGKFRIAEDSSEKALAILNKHFAPNSLEIVLTKVNLAGVFLRQHRTAEAEKILPAAVEVERSLLKDGRTLADGIRNLAALRVQQHSWAEAESLYLEAIGYYERKLGADHPDIAGVLREYAGVLKHQGAPKARLKTIEARAKAIENPASRSRMA